MRDQAHELRSLKLETALAGVGAESARPWTLVVTGGKGGVGISTLSANLAATLSRLGRRVLLTSAAERPDDLAMICGFSEVADTSDQVRPLQGANGLMMVRPRPSINGTASARMHSALTSIRQFTGCSDIAIIDAGSRWMPKEIGLGGAVDSVLYVTTSDNVAVMDTYAAIKEHVRCGSQTDNCRGNADHPRFALVVNRCHATQIAKCAYQRIDDTCKRFLQTTIQYVGEVPDDSSLCEGQTGSLPAVLQSPTSPAAKAIHRLATNVVPAERR